MPRGGSIRIESPRRQVDGAAHSDRPGRSFCGAAPRARAQVGECTRLLVLIAQPLHGLSAEPSRDGAWGEPLLAEAGAKALVAALVAERHDLLPHPPGVRAALVPAVIQVGLEGVEFGWSALPLALEQFLRSGCVGEELDDAGVIRS